MQTRVLWLMWGILAALVVGGWILNVATWVPGTTGTFKTVLPAALGRAREWSSGARLVGFAGRDLVNGKNGQDGGWEFDFTDPASGGACAVTVADNLLALRAIPVPTATDEVDPTELQDTDEVARELANYGMRPDTAATISYATGELVDPSASGSLYVVSTAGRWAATWLVDARRGTLLNYGLKTGMNAIQ